MKTDSVPAIIDTTSTLTDVLRCCLFLQYGNTKQQTSITINMDTMCCGSRYLRRRSMMHPVDGVSERADHCEECQPERRKLVVNRSLLIALEQPFSDIHHWCSRTIKYQIRHSAPVHALVCRTAAFCGFVRVQRLHRRGIGCVVKRKKKMRRYCIPLGARNS